MNLANILIGIILLVIGGLVLVFSLYKIQDLMKSKDWPAVEGKITDMRLTKQYDEDSGKFYRIDLRYEYQFGDSLYSGEDKLLNYQSKKRELKKKYAPGEPLTAYYNPEQIGESVLEPGINLGMLIALILIPVILMITGGVFLGS
ncbi:MAG: DUF3592 domain-containing protein [Candidatus Lokiarchaeota archaeon]|nr:DUF3592 domain-containing protein [Candidatus Lokiarchaeota archaeon]